MSATAYPLTWPDHFPRAKWREPGKFKTALPAALKNVESSLRLFATDSGKKLEGLVLSSNVTLGSSSPSDPGVAVWFTWDGLAVCIAVDRYTSVASNLQAIHHIVEARRVELRHGTLALVRATFQGFKALPAPENRKEWWDVLQCKRDSGIDVIRTQYRRLASEHHPDKHGGAPAAHVKMTELNAAMAAAEKASA
jgi:hypothetical protein